MRFCGFDVVRAHISHAVHGRSDVDREEMPERMEATSEGTSRRESNPVSQHAQSTERVIYNFANFSTRKHNRTMVL